ncbi:MurR/RpiR family transcriptional regulator [Ralstonia insidiosa]|jgi:DNA-binding MurR/RpiR family transcriptional regulator|uniref:MurR/RpiR family transcriptional regulator n=1 Tax=Ralstonia TaxID=48736 RepID=UPI00066489DA|nr:MurR/RpiR family transcriptional regulator [Ralstonia insidiosa]KMW45080.1 RpiR family transcriptional regulator [Ralstonia sp. MD27]MBX3773139.1 MurR/RpiR family transcriptional regulator [Ralstonia pickettii]NPA00711.1 MurR/RpiR family transcriptional regulator [Betaproteobacteria bacterium]MBA9858628.1 MurR/RpiR family transcriptional regulator [Ralstonia insidiosa]MBA9872965.1 MurR/RpiR family transcriptional regulator [Ralstonia insidiosa]
MTFEGLMQTLRDRAADLSPQLQRAAMLLETHQHDIALLSMRDLARRCDLPPATFSRLARALGFEDFAALRDICVNHLRQQADGFAGRASTLQGTDAAGASDAERIGTAIGAHVQSAFSPTNLVALEAAADALCSARRVYLLGARSCLALTHAFGYAAQLFDDKVTLCSGAGNTLADPLRFSGEADVVIAVTFDPYTREVIEAMQYAHARGARLVYVTDSAIAPGAELAWQQLVAPVAIPSFFHSLAAPLALLDALLMTWFRRAGPTALAHLADSDAQLKQQQAYVRSARRSEAAIAHPAPVLPTQR